MPTVDTSEKCFENDIQLDMVAPAGGYAKADDTGYDTIFGLWPDTLITFVKDTQPKAWKRFENTCNSDPERKFCQAFSDAVATSEGGIVEVLRHGFKHRGIQFKVAYYRPNNSLNTESEELYKKNVCQCIRQWHYSSANNNSVDMVLVINGIPVIALELKNQNKGQSVENAKAQWMYDRDKREICFRFESRIIAFFCVDLTQALMATKLDGGNTYFLPFNQGSNGPGVDGGAGNPANPNGYPTAYLWQEVLQKDSLLNLINNFVSAVSEDGKKKLIFPRYHQWDVVSKLVDDVKSRGSGHNYLIQHSAGSGKSNSIAWTAYRMASMFDKDDKPMFTSVIIVTDRRVLDSQLKATVTGFDHQLGSVIEVASSKELRDAINDGKRIIVTTLQKFPIIYEEVDRIKGRTFAIIVDEAHSSQTGSDAQKLKYALADTDDALKEYAEIEGKAEDEMLDSEDLLVKELAAQGKHSNLSFFAFTATPKPVTLEMFGEEQADGSFRPFHVYSMRQAIEEGFILDVLANYITYKTCYKLVSTMKDNPDVDSSEAVKLIKRYAELHPTNIQQKANLIVETFRSITSKAIGGKGKMMVVTPSRLAAVKYQEAIRQYAKANNYNDIEVLVAFSGTVTDHEDGVSTDYTEEKINSEIKGKRVTESQTKKVFHDEGNVLVVAEKFQTGFDEPLLHTMIVDKKLKGVKAVQTLSRLNRIYPGKDNTYILDFVNSADDIVKAFEPFYTTTELAHEINVDLIYDTQKKIRAFKAYDDTDINAIRDIVFMPGKKQEATQGKIVSALLPTVTRYNAMDPETRYQFRRIVRSFTRWYSYIAQITRMFDKDLHKEFVFLAYLEPFIPSDKTAKIDLDGKIKMEYFKLEKTYEGSIGLSGDTVKIELNPKLKAGQKPGKDPLEDIIEKVNAAYQGKFTDADRVIIGTLYGKLKDEKKLRASAKTSDSNMFTTSILPKFFDETAQESYVENTNAYEQLFTDKAKYNAIMQAIGDELYKVFRKNA